MNTPSVVLQYGIWFDAEYNLPHLLKGDTVGSGRGKDRVQKERDNWRGRHEDDWGGEVNWVGKTVENNLKWIWTHQMVCVGVGECGCVCLHVCVRECVCCWQLIHLDWCIGIYMCLCILCYFRQIRTSGVCAMRTFCSHFDTETQVLASFWLIRLCPSGS